MLRRLLLNHCSSLQSYFIPPPLKRNEIGVQFLNAVITNQRKGFCQGLSPLRFEQICIETLDSLSDYFDELVENIPVFKNGDIVYSDGVLTANLGDKFGTYVINRQSPNKQIWLSSPTSGPKRYDFINNVWIYKHDLTTLHQLLDKELEAVCGKKLEFRTRCVFGLENIK